MATLTVVQGKEFTYLPALNNSEGLTYTLGTLTGTTATIDSLTGAITATLTAGTGSIVITPSNGSPITLELTAGTFANTFLLESDADTIGDFLSIGTNATRAGFIYGAGGADTLVGGAQNDQLYGGAGIDSLVGNAGDDILNGGAGNDILVGGAGNDAYFIDSISDQVIETTLAGAGTQDTIYFAQGSGTTVVTYSLAANVENLYFTGSAPVNATGNASANIIFGGSGNDTLNGGEGADTLAGGGGNDTYIVGAGDVIASDTGGTDTVLSDATFTLVGVTGIENLTLTGTGNINGTGGTDANRITGNTGNNTLDGGAGNDTLDGGAGNDSLFGGDGNDTLDGGAGNDSLFGGDGTDSLIGGDGNDTLNGGTDSVADTLVGGNGDDTYFLGTGDTITDAAGSDTIISDITFSLATFTTIENLTLTGTGNIDGTGNTLANKITGNSGNNTLNSGSGTDALIDTLIGGAGDDTYIVNTTGDIVTELASEGTDLVQSSVTYTLGTNIENLTLTGTGAINGTGNASNNTITGGSGNNSLSGAAGTDSLVGGAGNDTLDGGADADTLVGGDGNDFYFFVTGDTIVESGASTLNGTADTVSAGESVTLGSGNFANIENLILTGTGDFNGTGSASANSITGNSGANILDGGAGNDTLIGGAGNDTYVVDATGDVVTEGANAGTDLVRSSVTYTIGANIENLTLTGTGNINGIGNTSNNTITGNDGNNSLDGGAGQDTLIGGAGQDTLNGGVDTVADSLVGGAGDDTYVVSTGDIIVEATDQGMDLVQSSATYTLGANIENLTLIGTGNITGTGSSDPNRITGNTGNNTLDGGAGNDTLDGGAGNDSLFGGDGTDSLIGGDGNDTLNGGSDSVADTLVGGNGDDYYIVSTGDTIATDTAGIDTIETSVDTTLAGGLENLILTGSALNGTGNTLANKITGNSGNNTLNSGSGTDALIDTLIGGAGDDTYIVNTTGDIVTELASEGTDLVQSSVTYTLGTNIENLTLTGTTAINGTGNASNNTITGNGGNNSLSGVAGVDTLIGGAGNDTLNGGDGNDSLVGGVGNDFYFYVTGDTIVENANEGTDTVSADESVTLDGALANIDNLILTGTTAINGTGNGLANSITGNSGANILDGGTGNDTLIGGAGNDTYVVDATGDVVTEGANAGTDLVQSSVTYTIGANIENLTLTGTGNINGIGNTSNNTITGNDGNNSLDGGAGQDTLIGGAGNDTLNGGVDTVADSLVGGAGDDTYVVSTGDIIVEATDQGTDLVQSSATYTLGANIENLTLTGTTAISGTGNALANVITGNSGNNTLNGGTDALVDTLVGGAGNDTYVIGAGDVVTELANAGTDTVQSSGTHTLGANIENLTLTGTTNINGTGNTLANVINGNTGNNTLNGEAGNDTINGGNGNDNISGGGNDSLNGNDNLNGGAGVDTLTGGVGIDTLTGGAGIDTFTYTSLAHSNLTNLDIITDFLADTLSGGITEVDKFDVPNAITVLDADTINPGTDAYIVPSLSAASIEGVLISTIFTANTAAVFTVGANTYLAINDATAGFSATTDAVINITAIDDYTALNSTHFI